MKISIADEFSRTPGPRSKKDGDNSGEVFLEMLLLPRFRKAVESGESLLVDLDGTEGYATSFLEAAFGGLAREVGKTIVQKTLRFKSEDEPFLEQEITQYIVDVQKP